MSDVHSSKQHRITSSKINVLQEKNLYMTRVYVRKFETQLDKLKSSKLELLEERSKHEI